MVPVGHVIPSADFVVNLVVSVAVVESTVAIVEVRISKNNNIHVYSLFVTM